MTTQVHFTMHYTPPLTARNTRQPDTHQPVQTAICVGAITLNELCTRVSSKSITTHFLLAKSPLGSGSKYLLSGSYRKHKWKRPTRHYYTITFGEGGASFSKAVTVDLLLWCFLKQQKRFNNPSSSFPSSWLPKPSAFTEPGCVGRDINNWSLCNDIHW